VSFEEMAGGADVESSEVPKRFAAASKSREKRSGTAWNA
jgi:hypothetical protein